MYARARVHFQSKMSHLFIKSKLDEDATRLQLGKLGQRDGWYICLLLAPLNTMYALLIHEGFLTAVPDGNGKCHSWMKLLHMKWHKAHEEKNKTRQSKTRSFIPLKTRFLFGWIIFCPGRKPFHHLKTWNRRCFTLYKFEHSGLFLHSLANNAPMVHKTLLMPASARLPAFLHICSC